MKKAKGELIMKKNKTLEKNALCGCGTQKTILIVEDDENYRETLKMFLENFGYKILEAANGKVGFELWFNNQTNIDLTISDMRMPVMSGPDMCERILLVDPKAKIMYLSSAKNDLNKHEKSAITLQNITFFEKDIIKQKELLKQTVLKMFVQTTI